jgi:hypothetical protein
MVEDLLDKGAIMQRDKPTPLRPIFPAGLSPISTCCAGSPTWRKNTASRPSNSPRPSALPWWDSSSKTWTRCGRNWGSCPGPPSACGCAPSRSAPGHHTFCRLGQHDAVGVGLHLDEKYHGMPLPFKFKIEG